MVPAPPSLRRLPLLLALIASAAGAQPAPAGARLVAAWSDGQREAADQTAGVSFTERSRRTVDGPGQRHTMSAETAVERGPDGPRRRVLYAEANGGPVAPERLARLERRVERSLGPGVWWTRGPALPALLERARAAGPARASEVAGEPAWEVEVAGPRERPARGGFDRGRLWFGRRPGPVRLLAARFERRLPAGGHAVLDAEFTRVAGLDLPLRHTAEVVVRQRRRVRWFTVLVRTEVEYAGHEVW